MNTSKLCKKYTFKTKKKKMMRFSLYLFLKVNKMIVIRFFSLDQKYGHLFK